MNILEEIADTEGKPMHETVPINFRILRSLYLHVLIACRDKKYKSVSSYIEELVRNDERASNPVDESH